MERLRDKVDNHFLIEKIQSLEDRVKYLEDLICNATGTNILKSHNQPGDYQEIKEYKEYDFDEVKDMIIITHKHLARILETSMEEEIISMILEQNKKTPFMKIIKKLCMYKDSGWVSMDDSDLKLLIEIIEHKILVLNSKSTNDPEKQFENNKIIYGLNLIHRFKKIKNIIIDNI
jgi:hypothetical protein